MTTQTPCCPATGAHLGRDASRPQPHIAERLFFNRVSTSPRWTRSAPRAGVTKPYVYTTSTTSSRSSRPCRAARRSRPCPDGFRSDDARTGAVKGHRRLEKLIRSTSATTLWFVFFRASSLPRGRRPIRPEYKARQKKRSTTSTSGRRASRSRPRRGWRLQRDLGDRASPPAAARLPAHWYRPPAAA